MIMPVLFGAMLVVWIGSSILAGRNSDRVSPVITSNNEWLKLSVKDDPSELMKGLTAQDNKDGDLTDEIMIGNKSKFISPGVCEVTYLVFDSSNNVGRYERKAEYTDYRSPEISVEEPLVFEVGSTIFILERLKVTDSIEGDISDRLKIMSSDVDNTEEGEYTVGVEVTNSFGDTVKEELKVQVVKKGSIAAGEKK